MSGNILIIGSSNTDMIIQSDKIPQPGETVTGGIFSTAAGGKGANQAVAVARSGGNTTFITKLGRDTLGQQALEGFKKESMNVEHVLWDEQHPTGVALIFVDQQGENSISVASGANAQLLPEHIYSLESVIAEAGLLLMQLEIPLTTVETALNLAHNHQVPVVLNPAPAHTLSAELLSKVHILTPNQSEAELLTGISASDEAGAINAAQQLIGMGVDQVVITMGEQGTFILEEEKQEMVPAFKVEAVDTTAAGDVFNGALTVALLEGKKLVDSVYFANAAAALSVTKLGAQPSIPLREETEEFLKKQIG